MRNYIVYFLTSLFLLFIVESKVHVNILHSNSIQHTGHLPQKANRLNRACEKLSIQNIVDDTGTDSSFELNEDDFQLLDVLQSVALVTSVFTLAYILGLLKYKRIKLAIPGFLSDFSTVKKFILIRSIRI